MPRMNAAVAPLRGAPAVRAHGLHLVNGQVEDVGPPPEWVIVYEVLKDYALERETAAVARTCTYRGVSLGFWVARQRRARTRLSRPQQDLLEALPLWTWSPRSSRWDDVYALLVTYTERTGSAKVPRTHRESGFGLGKWVSRMRSRQRSLSNSQAQALESLPGWVWHSRPSTESNSRVT